jgi:predicted small lipoprotein YifL
MVLLTAVVLALPLAGCGKKGDPDAPGADRYPRQYPAPQ